MRASPLSWLQLGLLGLFASSMMDRASGLASLGDHCKTDEDCESGFCQCSLAINEAQGGVPSLGMTTMLTAFSVGACISTEIGLLFAGFGGAPQVWCVDEHCICAAPILEAPQRTEFSLNASDIYPTGPSRSTSSPSQLLTLVPTQSGASSSGSSPTSEEKDTKKTTSPLSSSSPTSSTNAIAEGSTSSPSSSELSMAPSSSPSTRMISEPEGLTSSPSSSELSVAPSSSPSTRMILEPEGLTSRPSSSEVSMAPSPVSLAPTTTTVASVPTESPVPMPAQLGNLSNFSSPSTGTQGRTMVPTARRSSTPTSWLPPTMAPAPSPESSLSRPSKAPTSIPTLDPTAAPTSSPSTSQPSKAPTSIPTLDPTAAPTSSPSTSQPTQTPPLDAMGFPTKLEVGINVVLPVSEHNTLLTLTKKLSSSAAATAPIPVARSYDGNPWELATLTVAEEAASGTAEFQLWPCAEGSLVCIVRVEEETEFEYTVRAFTTTTARSSAAFAASPESVIAARFLLQSTFGPTSDELSALSTSIDNVDGGDAALESWMFHQMKDISPTLHRAYYRQRVNPRLMGDSFVSGRATVACEPGSRWHRFALTKVAIGATIMITRHDAGEGQGIFYKIKIEDVARAILDDATAEKMRVRSLANASLPEWSGWLCKVTEEVGGQVEMRSRGCSNTSAATYDKRCTVDPECFLMGNPPIGTASSTLAFSPDLELSSADVDLVPVAGVPDVAVLASLAPDTDCIVAAPAKFPRMTVLSIDGGERWAHDVRLRMLKNTLSSPAELSGEWEEAVGTCPSVPRSFVNEHSCQRRPACSPARFRSTEIVLNDTTISNFHRFGGSYVYSVADLRLEGSEYRTSPCYKTSRWLNLSAPCSQLSPNASAMDGESLAFLTNAINSSKDRNPLVRDLELPRTSDVCSGAEETIGARIDVDGTCFEHVHPHLYDVVDASWWTLDHPGNVEFDEATNPIKRFAREEESELRYPQSHPMSRYEKTAKSGNVKRLGRKGDVVDFTVLPTTVQTVPFAESIGAVISDGSYSEFDGFEACGSPGEVSNVPAAGARFGFFLTAEDLKGDRDTPGQPQTKSMVNDAVSLRGVDQLRQRVAWALSQIVVMGEDGIGKETESENWHTFFDILVRHSFGNYRDLLREVSYSPMMNIYLTYTGSGSYKFQGSAPDENYAREIMQLFTIGLWQLNSDGTRKRDIESGAFSQTYTNTNIMAFSRIWTGFDFSVWRGNLESRGGATSTNTVDPAVLVPQRRDPFPKLGLEVDGVSGWIGDGYPLCTHLPERAFLKKGATFRYLGHSPLPRAQPYRQSEHYYNYAVRLELNAASSALYSNLCSAKADGSGCTFPSTVVLGENLPCDGSECLAESFRVVGLASGNETVYYEYIRFPCVELTFFANGTLIKVPNGKEDHRLTMCADPLSQSAVTACCDDVSDLKASAPTCIFSDERTRFATAKSRCEDHGKITCPNLEKAWDRCHSYAQFLYIWLDSPCTQHVQVYKSGSIGLVHPESSLMPELEPDFGTAWDVLWANKGVYPTVLGGCASRNCTAHGDSCICPTKTRHGAVFAGSAAEISSEMIKAMLSIGSASPDAFAHGTYIECVRGIDACASNDPRVTVHVKIIGRKLDEHSIFTVPGHVAGAPSANYLNLRSEVVVGGDHEGWVFRNPPKFVQFYEYTQRDAAYETEALLDHLVYHPNTAPFISHLLIQRLVKSSPSPRYIEAVSTAFTKGKYVASAGTEFGVGKHGDLEATIAAILLDREARSLSLDADPTSGKLREPRIEILHFLRSLEYKPHDGVRDVELRNDLVEKVGQGAFKSPSVFNFYLPDFQPNGPVSDAQVVAPEAQIGTGPNVVGMLNGLRSLVDFGLTTCSGGFAVPAETSRKCLNWNERRFVDFVDYPLCKDAETPCTDGNSGERAIAGTAYRINSTATGVETCWYSKSRCNWCLHNVWKNGNADWLLPKQCDWKGPIDDVWATSDGMLTWSPSTKQGPASPTTPPPPPNKTGTAVFGPITVVYSVSHDSQSVDFYVKNEGIGWVALGVSPHGGMTGSGKGADIVACSDDQDGKVLRYWVKSRSKTPDDGVEIPGSSCERSTTQTTMRFTLLTTPSDPERQHALNVHESGSNTLIWAVGDSQEFRYHGARGEVPNFSFISDQEHETELSAESSGPFSSNPIFPQFDLLIQELNLLLTGARLNSNSRAVLKSAYDTAVAAGLDPVPELVKIIVSTSEWHTTNDNLLLPGVVRPKPKDIPSGGRPYKAVVMLFLIGGADSYNFLIPHSDCSDSDLYEEYASRRDKATLKKERLLQVASRVGDQPCGTFGLHPSLGEVCQMYNEGNATWFANVGALIEPTSSEAFKAGTARLPPSLFAHNVQQRVAMNVHQGSELKGVLGRILNALGTESNTGRKPYKCGAYSISGVADTLSGWNQGGAQQVLSRSDGAVRFSAYHEMKNVLNNLTEPVSESVFAETSSRQLRRSLETSEALGEIMDNVTLSTTFPTGKLGKQLKQIAKIIASRKALNSERDAFYASYGSWDSHQALDDVLSLKIEDVDKSLGAFAAEMRSQGVWDDVVVLVVSEFGRTINTNGRGTDHGWGGHALAVGGSLDGGRILGKYPVDFLEIDAKRGRLIPTTPWEAMWLGVAQWLGVEDTALLKGVLPNAENFPDESLYTRDELFAS